MFQDVIKHDQRFDYDGIPTVLELCCQAGAEIHNEYLYFNSSGAACESLTPDELKSIATKTVKAYERLRSGLKKLLVPRLFREDRVKTLVLFDKGCQFYGHAPAVVELCLQEGAVVPTKYFVG
ncbi:hypothetical protein GIB67_028703 [Kingdonia uniflora]|uniref:APO domain-containing protein n=1 Tax=Kingdonia uniflora TaxID=39325 RepID=A0A7J7N9S6_9MAGN|nr:hypothetical protein GIB67_028703 [Kingdonia uniflora]